MTARSFEITEPLKTVVSEPTYTHGFSLEEETRIKEGKKAIEERDIVAEPVTLEEFKTIIVPWNRIYRTEQFILHPPKAAKKPRAVRVTKPKVKKLTKKAIAEKINNIVFKIATGEEVSEEEQTFYENQVKESKLS